MSKNCPNFTYAPVGACVAMLTSVSRAEARQRLVLHALTVHFLPLLILLPNMRLMNQGSAAWQDGATALYRMLAVFSPELASVASQLDLSLEALLSKLADALEDAIANKQSAVQMSHLIIPK